MPSNCMEDPKKDVPALVDCPACGQRVCASVISVHLDVDCPSAPPTGAKCAQKGAGGNGPTPL